MGSLGMMGRISTIYTGAIMLLIHSEHGVDIIVVSLLDRFKRFKRVRNNTNFTLLISQFGGKAVQPKMPHSGDSANFRLNQT